MAKKASTAVAATAAQDVAPLADNSIFESMPSGLEQVTASDLLIPRLTILQALSPQLQRSKPEYDEQAKAGMFCDTGTGDLFEDMIEVLPCYFARVFLEWAPRSTGKGMVANHGTNAAILEKCRPDEKKRMVLPNGNYIAETATYYVLNMSAGGRRSFIPLTSTQLKASRRWMTLITNQRLTKADGTEFTPPIFYRSWMATIIEQSNPEGSWFGWKFEPGRPVLEIDPSRRTLNDALDFRKQAAEGMVSGDLGSMAEEHANETGPSDDM